MKILLFKHIHDEPAGHAEQWAIERGYKYAYHYWDKENILTELPETDLLIIMGGMMGAYEEEKFPWLINEKKLIREAITSGKKVLGICLGAQLIASALGAKVYRNNHSEIGFHRVNFCGEMPSVFSGMFDEFRFFQWHGDTFELPEGAKLIATSGQVKNQAFSFGDRVAALQFHPEMNSAIIEGLLERSYQSESPSPWKQSQDCIRKHLELSETGRVLLYSLLDRLISVK